LRDAWKGVYAEIKNSAGGRGISDIMKAMTSIYIAIGTGFIYGLLLLYLMSAYAEVISWVCIVLTGIGLFGGSVLCYFMRRDVVAERGVEGDGAAV